MREVSFCSHIISVYGHVFIGSFYSHKNMSSVQKAVKKREGAAIGQNPLKHQSKRKLKVTCCTELKWDFRMFVVRMLRSESLDIMYFLWKLFCIFMARMFGHNFCVARMLWKLDVFLWPKFFRGQNV